MYLSPWCVTDWAVCLLVAICSGLNSISTQDAYVQYFDSLGATQGRAWRVRTKQSDISCNFLMEI